MKKELLPLCRTVFKYSPRGFCFFILEKIIYGILPGIRVYLFSELVNSVLHITDGEKDWKSVVPLLLSIFLVQFVGWTLREGKVETVLQGLGMWEEVRKLEDGAGTFLGKVKKGSVDLSLGQWQKLALARGLVSDAPVKILDEPTASLDPNLECEFYRKYEELCGNSETILISHRLASVQNAHRIFVLDAGKVAEAGTHDELMGLKGLYYEMYTQQKKWYD